MLNFIKDVTFMLKRLLVLTYQITVLSAKLAYVGMLILTHRVVSKYSTEAMLLLNMVAFVLLLRMVL